jgi:hypothetical protein
MQNDFSAFGLTPRCKLCRDLFLAYGEATEKLAQLTTDLKKIAFGDEQMISAPAGLQNAKDKCVGALEAIRVHRIISHPQVP